ncbi:hypothetical protein T10_1706 [Trichinella papuae]|uniref:Uncharacterized protein n=1 Tax=Trichinella papuae TaxID=268474 RepID=A0A0V1MY36_9BILA|nr:hypothetical protein T10_1706 [Trichinella papuae]
MIILLFQNKHFVLNYYSEPYSYNTEHGSDACDRHARPRVAVAAGCSDQEPAWARSPRATGLNPRDLRAHRPCARAGEGPSEDAATSTKMPARPSRQGVTLLPERPRVAGDATKREARPWLGGAVPGSRSDGAADVPRTTP